MGDWGKHESIWLMTEPGMRFEPLDGNLEVDVAVIGAGITGLTAALFLKEAGRQVAVIERGSVAAGATGTTSAHLSTLIDASYASIETTSGSAAARRTAEAMTAAIDAIEARVRRHGIDCGFARMPGFLYAELGGDAAAVEREFEAARRAGLPAAMIESVPLPFRPGRGLRVEDQAAFHPVAYCNGLARAFQESGGRIFTATEATGFEEGEPCLVRTARGEVRAADIVMATHTPLGINPLQGEMEVARSCCIAVRAEPDKAPGLFMNTADPYEYIRPFRLPDRTAGLVIGGKDHPTGEGDPRRSLEALIAYARERFGSGEVICHWTAQHYDPSDALPLIGRSPFAEHTYVATAFAGDGLTLGTLGGMIAADLILGRPNAWAELFKPSRLRLSRLPEFARVSLAAVMEMIGDRLKAGLAPEALGAGEGAVHGRRLSPEAAFRDEGGGLHVRSAVCPHLKCVVRFNALEKTWDCPCHGSRYGIDGGILEGPTLAPLAAPEE